MATIASVEASTKCESDWVFAQIMNLLLEILAWQSSCLELSEGHFVVLVSAVHPLFAKLQGLLQNHFDYNCQMRKQAEGVKDWEYQTESFPCVHCRFFKIVAGETWPIVSCYVPFLTKDSHYLFCLVFVIGWDFSENLWLILNKLCQPEAATFQAGFNMWNGFFLASVTIGREWMYSLFNSAIQSCWKLNFVIIRTFMKHINCAKGRICSTDD